MEKNVYQCEKCKKNFQFINSYTAHINKKIPCQNEDKNKFMLSRRTCRYCNKIFSRPNVLKLHIEKCKVKLSQVAEHKNDHCEKPMNEYLLEQINELKQIANEYKQHILEQKNEINEYKQLILEQKNEINELKHDNKKKDILIEKLSENKKNISIVKNKTQDTNIKNQQNIVNNNIKLVAFGKEDLSHITDEVYKLIISKGAKSVQKLIEYVHFNKDKPENHNIYISNMQNGYVLVFDGNDWKLRERDDVLQEMVESNTDILCDKFEEIIDKLDEPTIRKFKRFLDKKDDDIVVDGIKNDLKLILYNSKKIPEKTRQLLNL